VLVTLGVLVTALYSFRMFFLVFHGDGPRDVHAKEHLHESPWVVTLPLVLLAIPSVVIGWLTVGPMLFGDWFAGILTVLPEHDSLAKVGEHYSGQAGFVLHGLMTAPFWLAMSGLGLAAFIYLKRPELADKAQARFGWLHRLLDRKYWVDELYQLIFAKGSLGLGRGLFKIGDRLFIDGLLVNGSARAVNSFAHAMRYLQTGYLYHYAIAMILGLLVLLGVFVVIHL
jgi:NADH-quinone oxidoreductase subunit L